MTRPDENQEQTETPDDQGATGESATRAAMRGLATSSAAPRSAEELELGRRRALEQNAEDHRIHMQRQALHERIENDFRYHPPKDPEQTEAYQVIRSRARAFAHELVEQVPAPSRELSIALTKLEECVMMANAGVARHG